MPDPCARPARTEGLDDERVSARPLCALMVEDSEDDMTLVVRALKRGGYDPIVKRVETAEEMERELAEAFWEVIISDYRLPHFSAPAALQLLQSRGLDVPFIVVSGTIGEETAVELMKAGAHDYVMKTNLRRLPVAIERELREADIRRERCRAVEDLALHAQELARSNAELEQFVHVASHDLKEPLRMVASYTQLLAKRCKGRLDEEADQFITYAVEGAYRINRLIDDLLAYSWIGKATEGFETMDAGAAFDRAAANLETAIQESRAEVRRSPLPMVFARLNHVILLFQNLIDNAIKFRKENPPRVEVHAEQRGDQWLFSVRDNGIGIDSRHGETIFTIFQRLHRREEYPGNGMGLAVCKRIVEAHGGRIWVESAPGEGSAFCFTLAIPPKQETRS